MIFSEYVRLLTETTYSSIEHDSGTRRITKLILGKLTTSAKDEILNQLANAPIHDHVYRDYVNKTNDEHFLNHSSAAKFTRW